MFRRIKDISVSYGLIHGVSIKRLPQLIEISTTMKLPEACKYSWTGRCRKTYDKIFLGRATSKKTSIFIKNILKLVKCGEHFLMDIICIGAVNLIYQKCHAQILKVFACLCNRIFQFPEFLYIHHNDAPFVTECLDESVLVGCFHKHCLVNVHIEHHGIKLVT